MIAPRYTCIGQNFITTNSSGGETGSREVLIDYVFSGICWT